MIRKLVLDNFKSFACQSLDIAPCTLLTGLNSSGKSTVQQAICMLDERHENRGKDFLSRGRGESSFSIKAEFRVGYKEITVHFPKGEPPVEKIDFSRDPFPHQAYLSADRFGPRRNISYNLNRFDERSCGEQGEYVFPFLEHIEQRGGIVVPFSPESPEEQPKPFRLAVKEWLGRISPGTELEYKVEDVASFSYGLFNGFSPVMVGFGLSYTLPVIVDLLAHSTQEYAGILLLENPEAHLHPAGQTQMGRLIARCVAQGHSQVIVETHSDHILSGIRLALKDEELNVEDAQCYYFSRRERTDGTVETRVKTPVLQQNGSIDEWPEGFFDESEKNILELL